MGISEDTKCIIIKRLRYVGLRTNIVLPIVCVLCNKSTAGDWGILHKNNFQSLYSRMETRWDDPCSGRGGYFWNNFGGKTLKTVIGMQIFGNARCEDTIKMDIRSCELTAHNSPQISISMLQFWNMLI